jgi:hypothetical protein
MKLRALLLGTVSLLGLLVVPMATPSSAQTVPVMVCAVAGTVDTTPVGSLPFAGDFAGTYTFFQTGLVCVGARTGTAVASSSGSTGLACGAAAPAPVFGQFCGLAPGAGYSTTPFTVGGSCSGRVGGTGLWNKTGTPATALTGPWSLTSGPLITGWIDCGGTSAGAIALVAVPLSPNTRPNAANPDGGSILEAPPEMSRDCGPPPDGVAGPPVIWFCRIFVAGVAVIAGV